MKQVLYFLFLFVFLSSCSYRETILRKVPDFLSDKIEDYLELDEAQEEELRSQVTSSFFEHHKEVIILRKILADYDITKDSLRKQVVKGYPPYSRVLKDVNAISIEVLSKLDSKQRKELVEKQKKANEKRETDLKSYKKRGVDRLSRLFGELTPKQDILVEKLVVDYLKKKDNLKASSAWRKKFVETLKIDDQIAYQEALKRNFSDVEDLKQVLKDNEYFFKFFDEFQKSLTSKQVEKFNKKKQEVLAWIDLYLKIYKTPINHT